MNFINYSYSEKEIKEILSTLTILIDTREQKNEHITSYLESKKINYINKKLDHGDYGAMIPQNEEYGIMRNVQFPVYIERKNSVDELVQTIKERTRFENELIRARDSDFILLVEDSEGYENLIKGNYRSKYNARALLGSLKTFESRYNFTSVFVSRLMIPNYIYHHLYYNVREKIS